MFRNWICFIGFVLLSEIVFSQQGFELQGIKNIEFTKDNFRADKEGLKRANENINEGDRIFETGAYNYKYAISYYLDANSFNPNNDELNYKIGKCYLYSNNKVKSILYLEKALLINPDIKPDLKYLLARGYHLNNEFDKALLQYNAFKAGINPQVNKEEYLEVTKRIEECNAGAILIKNPIRVFIDNMGKTVNSKYPEYSPFITADESVLFFTARKENTTGGERDQDDNVFFEDIYISFNIHGKWTDPSSIGSPINTESHDATAGLSADGQKLFVFDGRKNGGDILLSQLQGDSWSKPEKLDKQIYTPYRESSACLSPDENTLYFVSNRPDLSIGGRDIYYSVKDDKGHWGKPINIGSTINTPFDEESIFIHPDGKTLFFSSQGHNSMGGYDIFKSVNVNGQWTQPENIGYPVNTPDDDLFFVLAASGKRGYFASFRPDGFGDKDLYSITFLGPEKNMVVNTEDNLIASITSPIKDKVIAKAIEVEMASTTIMKGTIIDEFAKKPIEAEIELVDNIKGEVIASFKSNSKTGKFLVSLPSGKNYGIAVKAEGYLFHSENFDIPLISGYQEITKEVALKNVSVGSKIVLRNIFFDFGKYSLRPESTSELERLYKLLFDASSLRIEISGHTDNKGSAELNKKLSEDRAKAVVDYLILKGIDANRLTYKGYGKDEPIETNDTEQGRQFNRRTEFKILSK